MPKTKWLALLAVVALAIPVTADAATHTYSWNYARFRGSGCEQDTYTLHKPGLKARPWYGYPSKGSHIFARHGVVLVITRVQFKPGKAIWHARPVCSAGKPGAWVSHYFRAKFMWGLP